MKISFLLAAYLVASATPTASAMQAEFWGKWERSTPSRVEYFVTPTGTQTVPPFTDVAPAGSINVVLPFARFEVLNGNAVTINVAPGQYGPATNGEVFPLVLPPVGVSLETWGAGVGTPGFDRAELSVQGPLAIAIDLDFALSAGLELPTVIQGLRIVDCGTGISTVAALPSDETYRVVMRDNEIFVGNNGIELYYQFEKMTGLCVIEKNIIQRNILGGGRGVWIHGCGSAADIVRANRISCFENNIYIALEDERLNTQKFRPRILSNELQLGEWNLRGIHCDPFVINNTLAFALSHSALTPQGMQWNGSILELHNNAFYNPNYGMFNIADLITAGAVNASNNWIEDQNPGVDPGFESGPDHPEGCFPIRPDLHINRAGNTSPLASAGNNFEATDVNGLITLGVLADTFVNGSGNTIDIRVDTNVDMDQDPRILAFESPTNLPTVEIGADEISSATLEPAGASTDALGNVRAVPVVSPDGIVFYQFTFAADINGVPGTAVQLMLGVGYDDFAVVNGIPFDNQWLHNNIWFSGLGNFLVDLGTDPVLGPKAVLLPVQAIPGTGILSIPLSLTLPASLALVEGELLLQAVVVTPAPGSTPGLTNRVKVELNL